ncbi:uncharacterized protein MELLADRAFT_60503 [Melampsora larici-populina 98AG31]|uniref:Uncharacterized protein n=1 Tax=Melampsora larici-populina (strain 98AG31 / pathotype 3-4-7) TaxID=747676 RepID=F4RBF3_MELLP|nr:uncharacterized protein MELLADRAFT_60503 [Melampsora larici-populina 98AG31]EGG10073.1 hypothetical protein MELLADRAFT_60503 [Melampsora larici-populina 98AG31]
MDMLSTPDPQPFNNRLPPPSQPHYNNQAQMHHPPYFNGPGVPHPQHFNRSLPNPPIRPPTTEPIHFNHGPAQDIYFKNQVSFPFFHLPILPPNNPPNNHPPNNPTQSLYQANSYPAYETHSNPARVFQGSIEQLAPSRIDNIDYLENCRPATSTSDDLPPLDFSIIDNFESQAFERERQRILAQNRPSPRLNSSVTVIAPSQP